MVKWLNAGVMKGGPADEAGIKKGDVILKYEGEKIGDAADLRNMVANTSPGKEEKIELWRDKKPMEVSVMAMSSMSNSRNEKPLSPLGGGKGSRRLPHPEPVEG